jgi:hypothetical protein
VRERRVEQRIPADAGIDLDAVVVDAVDRVERADVDHDAGAHLHLAERGVRLAAAGDADAVAARESDHARDVVDRAGAQHRNRLLVHDRTEVLRVFGARGVVELQRVVVRSRAVFDEARAPQGTRRKTWRLPDPLDTSSI